VFRCRDRGDLAQGRTAHAVCPCGQSSPVVIGQAQPPGPHLAPQEPVLFDQVRDRLLLPAIQPAGEHAQHHLQRRRVDHEPERIARAGLKTSAEKWNTTPTFFSAPTIRV